MRAARTQFLAENDNLLEQCPRFVEHNFLNYMNTSLDYFEKQKEVFHINGFNNEYVLQFILPKYYFLHFMSCWGWATWKDRWDHLIVDHQYWYDKLISEPLALSKFNYDNTLNFHEQLQANLEGKIKTWAILWFSTVFFNKGLCLTPKFSYVANIGLDGSGVNCAPNNNHQKQYHTLHENPLRYFSKIKYRELLLPKFHLKMYYKRLK